MGRTPECPKRVRFSPRRDRVAAEVEAGVFIADWPSLSNAGSIAIPKALSWEFEGDGSIRGSIEARDTSTRAEIERLYNTGPLPELKPETFLDVSVRRSLDKPDWRLVSAKLMRLGGDMDPPTEVERVSGEEGSHAGGWRPTGGAFGEPLSGDNSAELVALFNANEGGESLNLELLPASAGGGWLSGTWLNGLDEVVGRVSPTFDCADVDCRTRTLLPLRLLSGSSQGDYLLAATDQGYRVYRHGSIEPVHIFGDDIIVRGWMPE